MVARDILFIDLETAVPGKSPDPEQDRIVSFAAVNYRFYRALPPTQEETAYYVINPGITMNDANIAIHGITNEMVEGLKGFEDYAETIFRMIQGKTLSGYNVRAYDIPVLWNEFARAGIDWNWRSHPIIDSHTLFVKREPRDLTAAVRFYLGDSHESAHHAMHDAQASARILIEQLNHYQLNDLTDEQLASETCHSEYLDISRKITIGEDGRPCYAFGKHKGEAVEDRPEYARWMLEKGTFSADTKRCLLDILTGTRK